MRPVLDMVAGIGAPVAPGGDPAGWPLAALEARECRFPIAGAQGGHRFCAMPVEPDAWRPGRVNGCYCGFHRDFLARQPRVTEGEDGEAA